MTEVAYISFLQFAAALQNETQAHQSVAAIIDRLFALGITFTAFEMAMLFVCLSAVFVLAVSLHMEQRSLPWRMGRRWESPYAFPLEMMHGLQASGAGSMAASRSPEPSLPTDSGAYAYALYGLAPDLSLGDVPLRNVNHLWVEEAGSFSLDGTQLPLFAPDVVAHFGSEHWQEAA